MTSSDPRHLRPAATVVVARQGGAGVEVLVVRRGAATSFAPGFVVFPGGVVEPGDGDLAKRLFGIAGERSRACALRELYEETGLLLTARGFRVRPAPRPPLEEVDFPSPSPGSLVEIARWVAPEDLAVRFDARFFAVAASTDVEPVPDGAEADRAWWARPRDILARRDGAPLMWPTLATLDALTACRTPEDVLAVRVPQAPRPAGVPAPPSRAGQSGSPASPILRLLAPNPGPFTLEGTNTWVVGRDPSVVIDPGPDDSGHIDEVARTATPVGAILLTHRHPDHAPGAPRLADAAGAPVLAFRPDGNEKPLVHGQVLQVGAVRLQAIHTPGHTPDHVCFLLEDQGALFTGDSVLGRGTSVIDPPEGDMTAYLRSLRQMRELRPRLIYPGHGPVVFEAMAKLDEYLTHRTHREEQVLAALAEGKHTAEEMVTGIYAKEVPESMFPVATRSILAHLMKLEREGRVARVGRYSDQRFALVEPRECVRCGRRAAPGSRLCRRCAFAELQERPER